MENHNHLRMKKLEFDERHSDYDDLMSGNTVEYTCPKCNKLCGFYEEGGEGALKKRLGKEGYVRFSHYIGKKREFICDAVSDICVINDTLMISWINDEKDIL